MRTALRILSGCYDALVTAGWMWLGVAMPRPGTSRRALQPPPLGHPERLRPDVPLSRTEQALRRQLMAPVRERE